MEKIRPQSPVWARLICGFIYLSLFFPLIMIIYYSFVDLELGRGTLKWYFLLFQDQELSHSLLLSLQIALISSLLSCTLGLGASIAIYKSQHPLIYFLKRIVEQALILPEIIFALSLLAWLSLFRFPLGYFSIVIAHVTFTLSFVIIMFLSRLQALDSTLEEAAQDLGASMSETIKLIILPQLKPAVLSAFLLSFILSFDDFLITYFIVGAGGDTLPIKIYARAKMGYSPVVNAISTLLLLLSAFLSIIIFKLNRLKKTI